VCLECRWLLSIRVNSHNLLYIDQKKNYRHGDCVKLLGHVVVFNNISAIFMSMHCSFACLWAVIVVIFAHCSVSPDYCAGTHSYTQLYISAHLG
jgi:hypothetical protein